MLAPESQYPWSTAVSTSGFQYPWWTRDTNNRKPTKTVHFAPPNDQPIEEKHTDRPMAGISHSSTAVASGPNPSGASADALNVLLEKFITQTSCRYLTEEELRNEWNELTAGAGILPLDMVCIPQTPSKWSHVESCRFIRGKNCKYPGTACGKLRKSDRSGMVCLEDIEINGKNYLNNWLCNQHMKIINSAVRKQSAPKRSVYQCLALIRRGRQKGIYRCPKRPAGDRDYCSSHIQRSPEFKEFLRWKKDVTRAATIPLPDDE
jgi:hypothetical protein